MNKFNGTVDSKGQIVIYNHDNVKGLLLQDEGKDLEISTKKAKKRRSDKQNRWLKTKTHRKMYGFSTQACTSCKDCDAGAAGLWLAGGDGTDECAEHKYRS